MEKTKFSFLGVIMTIGIIFGDIGTSVLYVTKSFIKTSGDNMNELLVLGFVSLIFWIMTLQTTIKYVLIALKADNKGEGGVFSLYALIKNNTKKFVVFLAMGGGATLLADGVITPAITVTSAIEGLHNIFPNLSTNGVVLIVLGIFIFIFSFQHLGTKKIGGLFGPIMTLWFLLCIKFNKKVSWYFLITWCSISLCFGRGRSICRFRSLWQKKHKSGVDFCKNMFIN